ncbi:MAG: hypothetical protein ACOX1N_03345 [Candidatus Methanomethylophilaceae archaeon]|jgi:hypothetical protein
MTDAPRSLWKTYGELEKVTEEARRHRPLPKSSFTVVTLTPLIWS